jgi:glycosyltransferase involved in cell wall biosynthesis
MACGTPVAAYPVTGPIDQIIEGVNGSMCEDLHIAVDACCRIDRGNVYFSVKHINWANSAQQFINYIEN